MNPRDRFLKTFDFQKPDDRLPMIEWAGWWDQTYDGRWKNEGLPKHLKGDTAEAWDYFGLDNMCCIFANPAVPHAPVYGGGVITDLASYHALKPTLYSDARLQEIKQKTLSYKIAHEQGNIILRVWLDGFFWYSRALLGIEPQLYAFYDQPELMHQLNSDLADFDLRALDIIFSILKPVMVGYAEDMSYNHGPMLSYDIFKEFLLPYYKKVNPLIKSHHTKILIDSDGDVTTMIPWFIEADIDGVYPLERQANVDIVQIRRDYPRFLMLGGYDKMVMPLGEAAMRAEFERILPVMESGGFVASTDHQVPPGVSFENYNIYLKVYREYTTKACS